MVKQNKISFSLLLFFLTVSSFYAVASEPDSLNSSLSTEKIMHLQNLWSESENAAGLQYLEIEKHIGKAALYYENKNGDYHRFQEGSQIQKYGFFTSGYSQLKKWKFYGDFSYYGEKDKDVKWVDVLEPYDDNPYTLGDEVGGKYIKEFFDMNGKGAWNVNEKLNFGFEVNYLTGVGTRRKDPRPDNKLTRFNFKPGIIYNLNKFKLGMNFRLETSKEDIELNTVTDSSYTFYHFKGLGAFTSTTEEGSRSSESIVLGGSLQFQFNGEKFNNLTEISFFQKETDIKRGVSRPLQIVLLEKFQTDINSVFMFKPNNKTVKKLKLNFTDKHIYGHEPVIEPTLQQENYQWSTVAKYILYWHKENTFGADYSYFKIKDKNHINWGTTFGANIYTSTSSYHFVPEKNEQELNYLKLNATFEKEITPYWADILFEFSGGYRKGFNSSYTLIDDEILQQTINSDFVKTDFDYYNDELFELGFNIQLAQEIELYKGWTQVFINLGYHKQISKMSGNPTCDYINLQLGINF